MYVRIRYADGSENLLENTNLVLVRDQLLAMRGPHAICYWKSAGLLDYNDLVVFENRRPVLHEIDQFNGGEASYRPFLAANEDKIKNQQPPLRVIEIFHVGALDLLADCG